MPGLRPLSACRVLACCVAAGVVLAPAARAQEAPASVPAADGAAAPGFLSGLSQSSYLLGDAWGLRPLLGQYGVTFGLQEISEVLGNVTGGQRRGFDYDGLTEMSVGLDTQRAFGWYGGTFNVSALQIHGRDLSADNLLTLQTASGIEAERSTRLWEMWYQQRFLDDRLDVKVGQQSVDQEFMVSQNSSMFVNTMMGWPMVPSADMPGGGPAYPLSALGVRLRAHLADQWTLLSGIFSGSPGDKTYGDAQRENPSGTLFPLNVGTLVIAEIQYAFPSQGTMLIPGQPEALARTYKFGFWYDNEAFPDLADDTNGVSLASPASNGIARMHRGNWAVYAVADQMIWQDAAEPDHNLNAFIRPMGTPLADRNLVTFSVDAGLTLHEPFPHRDDDSFGIGMGYAHVSGQATALDMATTLYTGAYTPLRGGETFAEATYQYEVTPWWQLQPDLQYVFNPGAGIANPTAPTTRVKNETVLGMRTTITF